MLNFRLSENSVFQCLSRINNGHEMVFQYKLQSSFNGENGWKLEMPPASKAETPWSLGPISSPQLQIHGAMLMAHKIHGL